MARSTSTLVDFSRTVAAAGGETTEAFQIRSDTLALQYEVSGTSTDTDVRLEARLADDAGWQDWLDPRTGLGDGAGEAVPVDVVGVEALRVRVTNNDGTAGNDATVRVVVVS